MQNIIGQTRLLSIINSYTSHTLPKSLMFVGPSGCGKRTMAKYVAYKFALDFVEIDDTVLSTDLDNFMHRTLNTLYLIDLTKFSEKQQNQFLKFIEEPSKSVYIVLITNSETTVLNTILNRCIKYTLEPYSKEQIELITNSTVSEEAFKIFKTPGKLLNLTESSFRSVIALAENIVHTINSKNYANTIAIATKINYKDLYNKIDFNLFFDAVEYVALEDFKKNNTKQSFIIFTITNNFRQYVAKQTFIKEMLMLNYLTTIWEATR